MATSYSGDAALTQHHPRIVTTVSNSQEIYQSGDGGLKLFAALICEKGGEDIQLITSTSELIAKTGSINAAKYGQAANNIFNWIQAGGEALVMRVLPDNATFAHAFLDIQTKFIKADNSAIQARKVITTSNANNVKKLLENELEDAKIPQTSDGYDHNVIALFTPNGRGKYYNNIGFRLTLSKQFDNVMNSRLYNIEVVKFKNDNLIDIVEGPFLVSFNPEALSPINQESIFIEDILNKYSNELSCKVNVENFIKLAKLINEDANPFVIDPIFGQTRVINGKAEEINGKDVHIKLLKQNDDGSAKVDVYGDYIPNFVDENNEENAKVLDYQNSMNVAIKEYNEEYIKQMTAAVRSIKNSTYIGTVIANCETSKFEDTLGTANCKYNLIKAMAYADLLLSDAVYRETYKTLEAVNTAEVARVDAISKVNIALAQLDAANLGLAETAALIANSGEEYEKIERYTLVYNDLVSLAKDNKLNITAYSEDIENNISIVMDIISQDSDKQNAMNKLLAPANVTNVEKSIYDLVDFLAEKLDDALEAAQSTESIFEAIEISRVAIQTAIGTPDVAPALADAKAKLQVRTEEFTGVVARNYAFSSNNIFRLNGGSEGDLEDENGNIVDNVVKGLLVSAYSGTKDPSLTDKRVTTFNFILDANYPVEVKDTIANFAENVRRDFIFIADCKIQGDAQQTLNFRRDEFKADSNLVAIYGQAVVVYDEFTGKDRQFTMPYILANKIPALQSSVGLHYPIAGNKRGVISGFKSINYLPNDSYQELLYTNRINYAINDSKRTKLNSQLTSAYSRTPLSDLNNVITMLNIRRDAEGVAEGYQFEFADSETMRLMQQELNETLNKYVTANAADSIACTVYASEYDLQNHVIRVTISIKFKDIIETVLITLEVTR